MFSQVNKALVSVLIGLIFHVGFGYSLTAQTINQRFEQVTVEEGLSQASVNCIIQDSKGYLWIGTNDGLNKYDGYEFEVFQYEPHTPEGIAGNVITNLLEDDLGKIWFTTENGLGHYNPISNSFGRIPSQFVDSLRNTGSITVLANGKENEIWLTIRDRFYTLHAQSMSLDYQWSFSEFDIDVSYVNSLVVNQNRMWIGTNNGLFLKDLGENPPKQQVDGHIFYNHLASNGDVFSIQASGIHQFSNNGELIHNYIRPFGSPKHAHCLMAEDPKSQGNFWVYSRSGLLYLNTATGVFTLSEHNPLDESSISSNFISSLVYDKYGTLWVGNLISGLDKLSPSKDKIEFYNKSSNASLSLAHNDTFGFLEDSEQNIWIGGRGGLNKLSKDRKSIKQYLKGDFSVGPIIEKDDGNLWVGTGKGLYHFDPLNETEIHYPNDCGGENDCYYTNVILSLTEMNDDIIMIGSYGGISFFNTKTFSYIPTAFDQLAPELLSTTVSSIEPGINQTFWITTVGMGIYHYSPLKNEIKRYSFQENNINSLSHNLTFGSYTENDSIVWIITYGGGLNRLNLLTDEFKRFTSSNSALKTNSLDAIQVDQQGILWIGTDNGLLRFDPKTYENRLFGPQEGLQGKEFHQLSSGITKSGELIFGGVNGVNIFKPEALSNYNQIPPDVHITSVRTLAELKPDENSIGYEKVMLGAGLPYHSNDITFDYIGLHYLFPEGNNYKIKLEPYDHDWRDVEDLRQATYTNLDPGNYIFQVTASNIDGIWQETPTTFSFSIHKPWWQTYWFYSISLCLLLIAFYFVRKYEIKRLRLAAALDLEKVEGERLKQLDKTKSDFFANISHEFRTPLTVILGELEIVLEKADQHLKKGLKVSKTNANNLLVLVNQLLDLSKLEAGGLSPQKEQIDLSLFMQNQLMSLESLAWAKNIELSYHNQLEECLIEFDSDMLSKIANNLLSNAIKFTPEGGTVQMNIKKGLSENEVLVEVEDTGPGIAKENNEKIFNRFFQVNSGVTRKHEGTGIGLALTKELVQLHGGQITVNSDGQSGSKFTISLKCLSIIEHQEASVAVISAKNGIKKSSPSFEALDLDSKKAIIQVVEDNFDVRSYIKRSLSGSFQVIESENGKEGLKQAFDIIPDLIITDVMMPEMDGLTFSTEIKKDQKTSHVPVIILTARSGEDEKIEGLTKGVDDFLTKPFNKKELLVRIENLLKTRQLLKEKYKGSVLSANKELAVSSIDQQFLNTIYSYIDKNIAEEQLGVVQLAELVHMSESQLNRKLKALVGYPPGYIIRQKRLNLAVALLEKNAGTISQIAFQVGFSDLATFTRSFKKEFGKPPSQYLK